MYSVSFICPACQTPQNAQESVCRTCGLLFASQPLSSTNVAASLGGCPYCAYPAPAGTCICGACGHPLIDGSMPLRPGQSLAQGRYTVQRLFSRGGMGALYLATDHGAADRTVVIKALLDYFDPSDPRQFQAARARLLREAATLATLSHPAIPRMFTSVLDGPHQYIVMQYIAGHDLEQRLTHMDDAIGRVLYGQSYPREDVLRWGIALCRVVEYLHGQQPNPIIHHDIKPANLIVDRDRDALYLVDFGTAGAHLPASAGTSGGKARSSLYGTVGYAPPEQYAGHSEPRSDVYALAATLYQLATDDNPHAHPFHFPHLARLGALGEALGAALQQDIARRPAADRFRRRLEALLAPAGAPGIYAPNGVAVAEPQALVSWCERHWAWAVPWLYTRLPDQIELWWGNAGLAEDLRTIVHTYGGDRDAGLDAALARIDPHGFGAARPLLRAGVMAIDFGALQPQTPSVRSLMMINEGRRYVQAQIRSADWLAIGQPAIALRPGQEITLTLTADPANAATHAGPLHGDVVAYDDSAIERDGAPLIHVEVRAGIVRRWSLLERVRRSLLAPLLIVGMLIMLLSYRLDELDPAPACLSFISRPRWMGDARSGFV